jgi:hypothetical protein
LVSGGSEHEAAGKTRRAASGGSKRWHGASDENVATSRGLSVAGVGGDREDRKSVVKQPRRREPADTDEIGGDKGRS